MRYLADELLLRESYDLGARQHEGQQYGDKPYFYHPIKVAELMVDAGYRHPKLVAGMRLHDVCEDTDMSVKDLAAYRVSAGGRQLGFPPTVVNMVDKMTFTNTHKMGAHALFERQRNPDVTLRELKRRLKVVYAMGSVASMVGKYFDATGNGLEGVGDNPSPRKTGEDDEAYMVRRFMNVAGYVATVAELSPLPSSTIVNACAESDKEPEAVSRWREARRRAYAEAILEPRPLPGVHEINAFLSVYKMQLQPELREVGNSLVRHRQQSLLRAA